jgi:biotin carboxylase
MKKIVIIGANEFQNPLIQKAKSLGYETHVFAWKCGDIGEKTADFFYPISIVEKEKILNECKKIKPDAICSIGSDLAVLTVTYVANKLGLPSNDYQDSLKCTNKYEMRKAFFEANIEVPKFEKVNNINCLNDLTFPKIVKPTDRSGSRAISLVNNQKELEIAVNNAINNSFEKCAIIEDVINSEREYSCESITYNGKHTILAVTKKFTTGFPKCIETGHIEPSDLSEKEMENVKKIVPKALDALNIKNSPSHTEFKVDENGNIHIIEIGARMGGDCIGSHLVMLSTGYDYLKMTIEVALGQKPNLTIHPHYKYSLIKFIFNQKDLQIANKMVEEYPDNFIEKSDIQNINHEVIDSSSRFGYFIFAFNDYKIIKKLVEEDKIYG